MPFYKGGVTFWQRHQDLSQNIPRVAFKRPPNLGDLLVRRDPQYVKQEQAVMHGSSPCNRPRCKTCHMHAPVKTFTAHLTSKTYDIRNNNNCGTSNLIYQLRCTRCPAEYVGLTKNTHRTRMDGHRQDVREENLEKPVALHAHRHGLPFMTCFTTCVIRSLPPSVQEGELRRWKLAYKWIRKSSHKPNLNLR